MKTELILFIRNICMLAGFYVLPFFSYCQNMFQHTYTSMSMYSFVQNNNGFICSSGGGAGSFNNILKTDEAGNVVWFKKIAFPSTASYSEIKMRNDNSFIVAASINSGNSNNSDTIIILNLDSLGNNIWSRKYFATDGSLHSPFSFDVESNDDIIVQAHHTGVGGGFFLFKMDNNGNVLWSKAYIGQYPNLFLGGFMNDITSTADGGFVCTGYIDTTYFSSVHNSDVLLCKGDSAGNLQWFKAIGSDQTEEGNKIIQTNDDGFAITGRTSKYPIDGTSGTTDILLCKTDKNGNVQFEKNLGSGGTDEGYDLIQQSDSSYAVLGNVTNGFGFTFDHTLLVKTSKAGTLDWIKAYLIADGGSSFSLLHTTDDGFAFCKSGAIIKTNHLGLSGCDEIEPLHQLSYFTPTQKTLNPITITETVVSNAISLTPTTFSISDSVKCLQTFCRANFQITTTATAGLYNGTNLSVGNNLTYLWDFGDGSTSNVAYPTHTYGTPGQYNVCLTVSNITGCTDTYCDSSYLVFKTENGLMNQLNILSPLGINEATNNLRISIRPNPATSQLFIETNGIEVTEVNIYNTTGSLVSQGKQSHNNAIDISQFANGIYVAEIKTKEGNVKRRWVKM